MSPVEQPREVALSVGVAVSSVLAALIAVPSVRPALQPSLDTTLGASAVVAGIVLIGVAATGLTMLILSRRTPQPPNPQEAPPVGSLPALPPAPADQEGPGMSLEPRASEVVAAAPATTVRSSDAPGGLPDRSFIPDVLSKLTAQISDEGERVAYVIIDISDLDTVNRMFSHDVGDTVLEEVVDRLRSTLNVGDALFHYSGDEFVLLRRGIREVSDVDELAVDLLGCLEADLPIEDYAVRVRANLGIALVPAEGFSANDARRAAESALYRSTLQGPNRYEIYSHSARRELSPGFVAQWLHQSIRQREFNLHYQRIEDLSSRQVVGVEALLRWEHPDLGGLEPAEILPALRDTGLIVELGAHIVDEVCRQIAAWTAELGAANVPMVFVNIDPLQLTHKDFLSGVEESLREHGVSADHLCFELGQLSTLPGLSMTRRVLREAKALGITLALDNFGGPDTTFAVLRTVQLTYLKLDRGIVCARTATPVDDAFARGIISLSRDLGCAVVAEGIEDPASLDRARRMGCRLGQGYQLGPPVPSEEMTEILADSARSASPV